MMSLCSSAMHHRSAATMDMGHTLSLQNNIWIPRTSEAVLLEIMNIFLSEDQKNAHQNER